MTKVVTVAEAARLVQVSERTMRRWVTEGRIKTWQRSKRRRYVDLESAMEYRNSAAA